MRAIDGKSFLNISATTAAFPLDGGRYGADFHATWNAGSVTLQKLAADGSTWLTALAAWSADGTDLGDLPRGSYRFDVASATGVYVNIVRIPGE